MTLAEQKVNFVKKNPVFKRQVFINLMTKQTEGVEEHTNGSSTYDLSNCEIFIIRLSEAGMGTRSIRVANLHHN